MGEAIFISYRREDDPSAAQLLAVLLRNGPPQASVLIDTSDLKHGRSLSQEICTGLDSARAVVVVIGRRWMEILRSKGEDDVDWTRLELEYASARGIPVIPVLAHGAAALVARELPSELAFLADVKAVSFQQERQAAAHQELVAAVDQACADAAARRRADIVRAARKLGAESGDIRRTAASLLSTRYAALETEHLVDDCYFDVVYQENDYGRARRVGVICVPRTDVLTPEFINQHIAERVHPLIAAGCLHLVVVISPSKAPLEVAECAARLDYLRLLDLAKFQEEFLGLRGYVEALASEKQVADFAAFYIAQEFKDGAPALDELLAWVESDHEQNPVAVLGGYGVGKTSLSRMLAREQAKRHLEDPSRRIPILLALGTVVHEAQLEGIFGKEFTARFATPNFHFRTLEQLNRDGRLLIIFDGFDEMKHGMAATDFRANFRQINRLREGKARVLVLGRPNAMPTDERNLVFRGERKLWDEERQYDPEWGRWTERVIRPFSEDQTREFLVRFFQAKGDMTLEAAEELRDNITASVEHDLLSRPVQARMIADLALHSTVMLKGLTRFKIYEHFISEAIKRDALKWSRAAIGEKDRMLFQSRLAWWAWTRNTQAQGAFVRDEVPKDLLEGLDKGNAATSDALINEYIVGTLTEEKEAGHLYFAHRSFQEYLVADFVANASAPTPSEHRVNAKWITSEVASFLSERSDRSFVARWASTLAKVQEALPSLYLSLFSDPEFFRGLTPSEYGAGAFYNAQMILLRNWDGVRSDPIWWRSAQALFRRAAIHGDADEAAIGLLVLLQGDEESIVWAAAAMFERLLGFMPFKLDDGLMPLRSGGDTVAGFISAYARTIRMTDKSPNFVLFDFPAIQDRILSSQVKHRIEGHRDFGRNENLAKATIASTAISRDSSNRAKVEGIIDLGRRGFNFI